VVGLRRPGRLAELPVAGPGTRAIDRRVDRMDGGPEVRRYRPQAPHRFRGSGPLQEVTTHRLRRPDHWHLVTYGLSELDDKESDDAGVSGWGFELTFRLAAGVRGRLAPGADLGGRRGRQTAPDPTDTDPTDTDPTDTDPEPLWAIDLLTNLAAYVWTSGHPFSPGHHLDLRGPIRIDGGGDLTAAVIVTDPALGAMKGPFGVVEFLQVVALTADELELCRSWSTDGVVELLARRDPLFVTALDRKSVLADPGVAEEVARRSGGDGSALTELRVGTLSWQSRPFGRLVAQLGAGAAAALGPALRRELIADGASFRIVGDHSEVRFVVSSEATWAADGVRLQLGVPLAEVEQLAALFDGRTGWGRRPAWRALRWRVVP
jgi:suppressor of fused-like protein